MLKLVCQPTINVLEPTGTPVAGWRSRSRCVVELLHGRVVIKVALLVDTTGSLAGTPYLLIASRVGERLREGGWSGGEGTTLLGGEVGRIVEAEVEVKAVRVARVLLLLLVGHGELYLGAARVRRPGVHVSGGQSYRMLLPTCLARSVLDALWIEKKDEQEVTVVDERIETSRLVG